MLSVSLHNLRVVTSRNFFESKALGSLEEKTELQETIALNARIGALTSGMAGNEWFHHVFFKFIGVIEDVVVNAENLCDSTSIVNIRN
jgi:hypothetical protein